MDKVCATPAEAVAMAVSNCGLGVHNLEHRYAYVRKHLCIGIRIPVDDRYHKAKTQPVDSSASKPKMTSS